MTPAEIADLVSKTDKTRFDIRRGETLLPAERDKVYADIEKTSAETGKTVAETLSETGIRQARIDHLIAQIDNLKQIKDEYIEVEVGPEGSKQKGKVKVTDVIKNIETELEHRALQENRNLTTGRQSREEEDKDLKTATSAEAVINSSNTKNTPAANIDNPATIGSMDEFNKHSKKPYVYIQDQVPKSTVGGVGVPFTGGLKGYKVDLPPEKNAQGKLVPVRARDIFARATALGMTVREYLEKIYFEGKTPWRQ